MALVHVVNSCNRNKIYQLLDIDFKNSSIFLIVMLHISFSLFLVKTHHDDKVTLIFSDMSGIFRSM